MKPFLLLTAAAGLASAAFRPADSDGYYCIGPDYIAFQFGMAAPPIAPHILHVVRYGGGNISEPASISIPQFQVHGMRCRADAVDLAAFDAIHTVTLDSLGRPLVASVVPLAVGSRLPEWTRETANLSWLSRAASTLEPERRTLREEANGLVYVLLITATPDSVRECPPTLSARIVESNRDREVGDRLLFRGSEATHCARTSFAPIVGGGGSSDREPLDVLLDALVFGPRGPTDVSPYTGDLRTQFELFLRRADAYRTPRPPVGGREMQMVDAAWTNYERTLFGAAMEADVTALSAAYVDGLRPCYEWEGSHECPEREARYASAYMASHPDSPFRAYLPLLSAHRWLCAAEAHERANRHADGMRSRIAHGEMVTVARTSEVLLIRTAAQQLAQRGKCSSRD